MPREKYADWRDCTGRSRYEEAFFLPGRLSPVWSHPLPLRRRQQPRQGRPLRRLSPGSGIVSVLSWVHPLRKYHSISRAKRKEKKLDFPRVLGIIPLASTNTAGLCKGSTADSDSVCEGSNPSPAAKGKQLGQWSGCFCVIFPIASRLNRQYTELYGTRAER